MATDRSSLDRVAVLAFGLLFAVCTVGFVGIVVFAQFGVGPALVMAALMTIVIAIIVLALNQIGGF